MPRLGLVALGDHHQVAVADAVVDHRVPFHLEDVVPAGRAALEQVLRYRQVVDARHCLDRPAGGDPAVEGNGVRRRTPAAQRLLRQLQAALLVPAAAQVALLPQELQVFVDGAVGPIAETAADLQVGGSDTPHLVELADEVENLLLALGQEVVHRRSC